MLLSWESIFPEVIKDIMIRLGKLIIRKIIEEKQKFGKGNVLLHGRLSVMNERSMRTREVINPHAKVSLFIFNYLLYIL